MHILVHVLVLIIAGAGLAHAEEVTIGGIFNIPGWDDGELNQYAAEFAVEDFNLYASQIGANLTVNMVAKDTMNSDAVAIHLLQDFREQDVNLIVGLPFSSYITLSYDYIHDNDMVVLSHAAQAAEKEIDDNIFRIIPNGGREMGAVSSVVSNAGIDTLVIVSAGSIWGDSLVRSISSIFDGEVIRAVRHDYSLEYAADIALLDIVISNLVDKHGADKVGILFISDNEIIPLIQEMASYDSLNSVRWFGINNHANHDYMLADPVVVGLADAAQFTAVQYMSPDNSKTHSLNERFMEVYGVMPGTYGHAAYDAVWLLATTILQTQSTDTATLVKAIPLVADHTMGVSGHLELSEGGDLNGGSFETWHIVNNNWVLLSDP